MRVAVRQHRDALVGVVRLANGVHLVGARKPEVLMLVLSKGLHPFKQLPEVRILETTAEPDEQQRPYRRERLLHRLRVRIGDHVGVT